MNRSAKIFLGQLGSSQKKRRAQMRRRTVNLRRGSPRRCVDTTCAADHSASHT